MGRLPTLFVSLRAPGVRAERRADTEKDLKDPQDLFLIHYFLRCPSRIPASYVHLVGLYPQWKLLCAAFPEA